MTKLSSNVPSHTSNHLPSLTRFTDLLRNACSDSSSDEPGRGRGPGPGSNSKRASRPEYPTIIFPPSKRSKPEYPQILQREAPIPARYISKPERALSGQASLVCDQLPKADPNTYVVTSSGKGHLQRTQMPEKLSVALHSHTKAVYALNWSSTNVHRLASSGMDHTICLWNVWSGDQKLARVFQFHNAAVKDVKWSPQGLSVLSCGYDCSSRLIDVEKGIGTQIFNEDQVVGVVKFHPDNSNIFLSGGSKGHLKLWDSRTSKVVHEYIRGLCPILDVEFTINGKHFISSSDVSGSNVSENSIIVWDVSRQVPLSNPVEAYNCPCIRCHLSDPLLVAQSNGNYIAIFSSSPPFKLDKYKRYESHDVLGFPIKCNFNLDGEKLISGSSDGSIYFYSYRSSALVRKIKAYDQACIDVAFRPILPNVIASCSWNGDVSVLG